MSVAAHSLNLSWHIKNESKFVTLVCPLKTSAVGVGESVPEWGPHPSVAGGQSDRPHAQPCECSEHFSPMKGCFLCVVISFMNKVLDESSNPANCGQQRSSEKVTKHTHAFLDWLCCTSLAKDRHLSKNNIRSNVRACCRMGLHVHFTGSCRFGSCVNSTLEKSSNFKTESLRPSAACCILCPQTAYCKPTRTRVSCVGDM